MPLVLHVLHEPGQGCLARSRLTGWSDPHRLGTQSDDDRTALLHAQKLVVRTQRHRQGEGLTTEVQGHPGIERSVDDRLQQIDARRTDEGRDEDVRGKRVQLFG